VVGEVDIGVQAILCKIEFERIEWGRNHSKLKTGCSSCETEFEMGG